ncbi:uroporphyrinogen-III synthase [Thiohalorhabdus sp. Cl-TMA]|uniref:Uroporphyrinogen-III synthase n=1 Tax=Thiohalorhabdus methylotrophus TaxID=3242694 RepID=A0ABV4TT38_9GAMM
MSDAAWSGCRILVTRPAHQAGDLLAAIRDRGGEPLAFPTIEIGPPGDRSVWDRVSPDLEGFHWLFFASANAVWGFARLLGEAGLPWPATPGYAAIGRKTAGVLQRHVDAAILTPEDFRSESFLAMAEMAPARISGARVLIVRGEEGRELLPTTLEERGARVERLPAYTRKCPETDPAPVAAALAEGRLDAAVFTSPETFTNLLAMLDEAARRRLAALPLVVISPVTASAIRERGLPEPVVAPEASDEGLLRALEERVCKPRPEQ